MVRPLTLYLLVLTVYVYVSKIIFDAIKEDFMNKILLTNFKYDRSKNFKGDKQFEFDSRRNRQRYSLSFLRASGVILLFALLFLRYFFL